VEPTNLCSSSPPQLFPFDKQIAHALTTQKTKQPKGWEFLGVVWGGKPLQVVICLLGYCCCLALGICLPCVYIYTLGIRQEKCVKKYYGERINKIFPILEINFLIYLNL